MRNFVNIQEALKKWWEKFDKILVIIRLRKF